MVILSFDDAINNNNFEIFLKLFNGQRKVSKEPYSDKMYLTDQEDPEWYIQDSYEFRIRSLLFSKHNWNIWRKKTL